MSEETTVNELPKPRAKRKPKAKATPPKAKAKPKKSNAGRKKIEREPGKMLAVRLPNSLRKAMEAEIEKRENDGNVATLGSLTLKALRDAFE